MKNAIEKSVEGGYIPKNPSGKGFKFTFGDTSEVVLNPHSFLLDPLFWQALGKALGWSERDTETMRMIDLSGGVGRNMSHKLFQWSRHWHSFLDHLASGGDAESFFKELLNQN